jgi:nucleoside-diphosphate-sugar epimerase
VLDNLSTGRIENLDPVRDRIEFIRDDMRDPGVCGRACRDIEIVFHQAAVPSVPRSVENPRESHDANLTGTFNMLMAARDAGCRRFIMAASSSAYGELEVSPKVETLLPQPLSPYAMAKLGGELYCNVFFQCYGLETIALRYFNVFGPRQDPKSTYAAAIPAFVTAILNDRSPTVFGDGEQTRDFTFIANVVQANLLAAGASQVRGEVVNIGNGAQISVNQVIRRINELLGKDVKQVYADPRPGDVRHSLADITKARELLGYKASVDFDEGLRRSIDYYRNNPA